MVNRAGGLVIREVPSTTSTAIEASWSVAEVMKVRSGPDGPSIGLPFLSQRYWSVVPPRASTRKLTGSPRKIVCDVGGLRTSRAIKRPTPPTVNPTPMARRSRVRKNRATRAWLEMRERMNS